MAGLLQLSTTEPREARMRPGLLIPLSVAAVDSVLIVAQAAEPEGLVKAGGALTALGVVVWLITHYVRVVIPDMNTRMDAKEEKLAQRLDTKEAEHRKEREADRSTHAQAFAALVETTKEVRAAQLEAGRDLAAIRDRVQACGTEEPADRRRRPPGGEST